MVLLYVFYVHNNYYYVGAITEPITCVLKFTLFQYTTTKLKFNIIYL